jgi:hypothetical protein
VPNLNEFVYQYKDEAANNAPYQPNCGHALWFELFGAGGDGEQSQRSLADRILARMRADAWMLSSGEQITVLWARSLGVGPMAEALPGPVGSWKRCMIEFDGRRMVQATFWTNFKATQEVSAHPVTALQGHALTLCRAPGDIEFVTGYFEPGVLEVAVALASNAQWRSEHFTTYPRAMRELISELQGAAPRGLDPSDLEIAAGLADSWEQEAAELVAAARSIARSGPSNRARGRQEQAPSS